MKFGLTTKLDRVLLFGFIIILIELPFHGFLSTWFGSIFGYEIWFKVGKEILLSGLMIGFVLGLNRDRDTGKAILSKRVNQLILAFGLLHIVSWLLIRPDIDAVLAGFIINGRYFAMFLLAQYLALRADVDGLSRSVANSLVGATVAVCVIGLLQYFIFPDDFMENFGYGPASIPAQFTIDDNDSLTRVASTTRGPNPLGAFLILPAMMAGAAMLKNRNLRSVAFAALVAITLVLTFSRSAWLGAFVAGLVLLFLLAGPTLKKVIGFGTIPLLSILITALFALSGSSGFLSSIILHDDPDTGKSQSSTEAHFEAKQLTIERVIDDPLGDGPGTAGPASFYDDKGKEITEDYYLQLAREVGVLGLALFAAISAYVVVHLWKLRRLAMPQVLLASFIGLSVANVFLSVWANEEVAMIWWAFAGLYIRD